MNKFILYSESMRATMDGNGLQYPFNENSLIVSPDKREMKQEKRMGTNIFGKHKAAKSKEDDDQVNLNDPRSTAQVREQKLEKDFERKCNLLLRAQDWETFEQETKDFLRDTEYRSSKGYFYLGVCLYKQGDYENAIKAFKEAESLSGDDAQL